MKLAKIKKLENNLAEIVLKISDSEKKYSFTYSGREIFAADSPEELRKILRLLPASVTHSLVEKIETFLITDRKEFPFELEIEKEILQSV